MGNKKYDVIVVGELNVDLILNGIEGFPEIGKEKLAKNMTLTLGSSSAIFASNLSALGNRVAFLGKIGRDVFGELLLNKLKEKRVSTDLIIQDDALNTGATIVLNYDEDRAMITHAGAMEYLTINDISPEVLGSARHLHFSSYFLQPGIRNDVGSMFKMAKEAGLTTSFDAQWDPDEKWEMDIESILPYVDVFLPNKQELINLTKQATITQAIKSLGHKINTVVVKMGSEGSISWHNGKEIKMPAFKNKNIVDAIGAGDSFNAGFIFKFIKGLSIKECQYFGNLCGAVNTTAPGGTAAFTSYDGIMNAAKPLLGSDKENINEPKK